MPSRLPIAPLPPIDLCDVHSFQGTRGPSSYCTRKSGPHPHPRWPTAFRSRRRGGMAVRRGMRSGRTRRCRAYGGPPQRFRRRTGRDSRPYRCCASVCVPRYRARPALAGAYQTSFRSRRWRHESSAHRRTRPARIGMVDAASRVPYRSKRLAPSPSGLVDVEIRTLQPLRYLNRQRCHAGARGNQCRGWHSWPTGRVDRGR